jgi:hypothetical protein
MELKDCTTRLIITVDSQDGNKVAAHLPSEEPALKDFEPLRLHQSDYELLKMCGRLIEADVVPTRADFAAIGQRLHSALFTDRVQHAFRREREREPRGARLCIELRFINQPRDQDLSRLPWEYLCYKRQELEGGGWTEVFMSSFTDLILTRYLGATAPHMKSDADERLVPIDGKELCVLVATSDPKCCLPEEHRLARLTRTNMLVKSQLEALRDQAKGNGFTIHFRVLPNQLSFDDFKKNLIEPRSKELPRYPHIVHFIGHGSFQEEYGTIAFVSEEGGLTRVQEPAWIRDEKFVEAFKGLPYLPRVVLLHTCEGGKANLQGRLAGMAPLLIKLGIPAVVAMQHPITQDVAAKFSGSFYEAVGNGATVDAAVQNGRRTIEGLPQLRREFGTPVVYISTHDVVLLQKPTETKPQRARDSLPQIGDPIVAGDIANLMKQIIPVEKQLPDKFLDEFIATIYAHLNKPRSELSSKFGQQSIELMKKLTPLPEEQLKLVLGLITDLSGVLSGK